MIPSKLYSNRFERNFVFESKIQKNLTREILKAMPGCKTRSEFISTTYFEPVIKFKSGETCVMRFRQRVKNKKKTTPFKTPAKWVVSGPGYFEIKIHKLKSEKSLKSGTFLPNKRGKDIYSFLSSNNRCKFIQKANQEFVKLNSRNNTKILKTILPNDLKVIEEYLTPQIIRINNRKSFELESCKITLETNPSFYPIPIARKAFEKNPHLLINKIVKQFLNYQSPGNKYSKTEYPVMIVNISLKKGSIINEASNFEIEAKADLIKKVEIKTLMEKLRDKIINLYKKEYKLFPTEPFIKSRGEDEVYRKIIGWKGKSEKIHEVLTIIRLTKDSLSKYGYNTILKWKGDPQRSGSQILNRYERKEYLKKYISDNKILSKAQKKVKHQLFIIGRFKKIKHRIIIQDKNGRNFVISLDESTANKKVIQQLEVEYSNTVTGKNRKFPQISLNKSCEECMNFIRNMLKTLGAETQLTSMRKIDFVYSN